jgi:hypothetical protein
MVLMDKPCENYYLTWQTFATMMSLSWQTFAIDFAPASTEGA